MDLRSLSSHFGIVLFCAYLGNYGCARLFGYGVRCILQPSQMTSIRLHGSETLDGLSAPSYEGGLGQLGRLGKGGG